MKPNPLQIVDGADFAGNVNVEELDRIAYGMHSAGRRDCRQATFGNATLYTAWLNRNPSIYTFLVAGGEDIVGYVNLMPLEDHLFQRVLSGTIEDGAIQPEHIRQTNHPDWYQLYLCSIAVLPDYQSAVNSWCLLTAAGRKWNELAAEGVLIRDIAAVVWTRAGKAVCRALGMSLRCAHQQHGEVYHARFDDGRFPDRLVRGYCAPGKVAIDD